MLPTYNKNKMKKLIQSDRYLLMTFNDMMENNTDEDLVLKSLFNVNIKDYKKVYAEIT